MEERTYESLVMKYSEKADREDMIKLTKMTSEFVEKPYSKEEFLDKIEDELCYFLSEKEAKRHVEALQNEDPAYPKGGKWTKEQALKAFESMDYPTETKMYSENGVYYACNMVYSDYFPMYKDNDQAYIEQAYLFLKDKDYKGKYAKEKWYARKM